MNHPYRISIKLKAIVQSDKYANFCSYYNNSSYDDPEYKKLNNIITKHVEKTLLTKINPEEMSSEDINNLHELKSNGIKFINPVNREGFYFKSDGCTCYEGGIYTEMPNCFSRESVIDATVMCYYFDKKIGISIKAKKITC